MSIVGATWAQSDEETLLVIPLHPRVPTLLQLPDAVEAAWLTDRGEIRIARMGNQVYLRPWPGTPAGTEALLEVETATMRLKLWLRVVERATDAREEVLIVATKPEQEVEKAAPDAGPALDAGSAPDAGSSPSVASVIEPAPKPTEPAAEHDVTMDDEPDAAADGKSDDQAIPRFELSVHAMFSLAGATSLELAGYQPEYGRQSHRAIGIRLVGARPDAWWALQAGLGIEWPVAPLTYDFPESGMNPVDSVAVSGPWVQAELGFAARFGRIWIPTVHVDIGILEHLRRTERTDVSPEQGATETTTPGAVLTLGMGLHRRVQDLVLGLEFQTRYGWPDGYHSMAVFGTVGWVLHQGDEP